MITKQIGSETMEFSDTLKVAYNLREPFEVKTLQEVLSRFSHMTFEDQLTLIYTSYRAATPNAKSYKEFEDLLLNNLGVVALTNLAIKNADGLVYGGMSEEEREEYEKNLTQPTQKNV